MEQLPMLFTIEAACPTQPCPIQRLSPDLLAHILADCQRLEGESFTFATLWRLRASCRAMRSVGDLCIHTITVSRNLCAEPLSDEPRADGELPVLLPLIKRLRGLHTLQFSDTEWTTDDVSDLRHGAQHPALCAELAAALDELPNVRSVVHEESWPFEVVLSAGRRRDVTWRPVLVCVTDQTLENEAPGLVSIAERFADGSAQRLDLRIRTSSLQPLISLPTGHSARQAFATLMSHAVSFTSEPGHKLDLLLELGIPLGSRCREVTLIWPDHHAMPATATVIADILFPGGGGAVSRLRIDSPSQSPFPAALAAKLPTFTALRRLDIRTHLLARPDSAESVMSALSLLPACLPPLEELSLIAYGGSTPVEVLNSPFVSRCAAAGTRLAVSFAGPDVSPLHALLDAGVRDIYISVQGLWCIRDEEDDPGNPEWITAERHRCCLRNVFLDGLLSGFLGGLRWRSATASAASPNPQLLQPPPPLRSLTLWCQEPHVGVLMDNSQAVKDFGFPLTAAECKLQGIAHWFEFEADYTAIHDVHSLMQ